MVPDQVRRYHPFQQEAAIDHTPWSTVKLLPYQTRHHPVLLECWDGSAQPSLPLRCNLLK